MSTREPIGDTSFEDEGMPDPQDQGPYEAATGTISSGAMAAPGDTPLVVEDYGTTSAEAHVPEPLRDYVDREEPDPLRQALEDEAMADEQGAVGAGWSTTEDLEAEPIGLSDEELAEIGLTDEALEEMAAQDLRDLAAGATSIDGQAGDAVGRLIDPADREVDGVDDEAEAVAEAVGSDGGGLTAEELAMHVTADPPMDDTDGYVDS